MAPSASPANSIPATDCIDGDNPAFPFESIDQLTKELKYTITDAADFEDMVDVGPADFTISFGDETPIDTVLLTSIENGWQLGLSALHDHENDREDTDNPDFVAVRDEQLTEENE